MCLAVGSEDIKKKELVQVMVFFQYKNYPCPMIKIFNAPKMLFVLQIQTVFNQISGPNFKKCPKPTPKRHHQGASR
jgi:hypothetical protein